LVRDEAADRLAELLVLLRERRDELARGGGGDRVRHGHIMTRPSPTAALPHAALAARSSCALTSPVAGLAWPGQAARGSSSASLRSEARAVSSSWLNARCGRRGGPNGLEIF